MSNLITSDIVVAAGEEAQTWNQEDETLMEGSSGSGSGMHVAEESEHSSRELNWNTGSSSRVNQFVQEVARDYKEMGRVELAMKSSVQNLIGEMVMTGKSFNPITRTEKTNIKSKFIRFHSCVKLKALCIFAVTLLFFYSETFFNTRASLMTVH